MGKENTTINIGGMHCAMCVKALVVFDSQKTNLTEMQKAVESAGYQYLGTDEDDTGLPKLDRFFNGTYNKDNLIREFGLNPDKQTVLYAPSYKPTSIFLFGDQIPKLIDDYNVIVKLHPYSWQGKYASHFHHRYFEKMVRQYPGIHLVPSDRTDIIPYMFIADTMISDGSSVINEFLALERYGIIVDLPDEEQTHHDGTPLLEDKSSDWLKESFIHLSPGNDILKAVKMALNPPSERKEALLRDKAYLFSYTDGKSASRVKQLVDSILSNKQL